MRTKSLVLFLLTWICAEQVSAQSIRVRMPDTTGITGTVIDYPVYVDSSVSGKNVLSFQFRIGVNGNPVSFLGIVTSGTMSAGFATPTWSFNTSTGQISISAAGASALTGTGILFYIQMKLNNAGNFNAVFGGSANCFFNQGSPTLVLDDGYLQLSNPPSILAFFDNNKPITIGDSLRVWVYGGTAPYTYQVTNPAVASITSSGMLYASALGSTKVRVVSANNIVDTTDQAIIIRAMKVILPDTSLLPVHDFIYPVRVNNTSGQGVIAGSMRINFNPTCLFPDSILTGNTKLQNATITYRIYSNYMMLSFAGVNALSGAGDMFKIRFRIINPAGSNVEARDIVFNQAIDVNAQDGYVSYLPYNQLTVNPQYGNYFSGQVQQFNASGGNAPYSWTVTDTAVGGISSTGLFTARKGGVVRVKVKDSLQNEVQTNPIQVFDAALSLPDVSVLKGGWVTYPVFISNLTGQRNLNAIQFTIKFMSGAFDSIWVGNANTVSASWSVSQNVQHDRVTIAMAGVGPILNNGILLRIYLKPDTSIGAGNYLYMQYDNMMFNEGDFYGMGFNGRIDVVNTLQKDLGVNTIPGNWGGCPKTSRDTVQALVYNYDNVTFFPGDTVLVGYQINNLPISVDTVILNQVLSKNNSFMHTFRTTVLSDTAGTYAIRAFVYVPGDISRNNDTNMIVFQIYPIPQVDLGADTLLCYGQMIQLDATAAIGNYLWSTEEISGAIWVDTSGTYWVKVTGPGGCHAMDTIVVSLSLPPEKVSISLTPFGTSCSMDSVRLSIPSVSELRYQWIQIGGFSTDSTDTLHAYMVNQTGDYTVVVSNSAGCTTTMEDTSVTLFSNRQEAPLIMVQPFWCEGDSLLLQASYLPDVSYRWSGPGNFSDTNQYAKRGNILPGMSGLYSLYAIKYGATGICDTSVVVNRMITIHPLPEKTSLTIQRSLSFCQGDSVILSVPTSSLFRYQWYRNNIMLSSADTLSVYHAKLSGIFTVSKTDTNGCRNMMRDTTVVLNPKPNAIIISGNANVLVNSIHGYSVATTSGSNYFWTVYNGIQTGGGTTANITVQWGGTPDYGGVRVVERSAAGCFGDTANKLITILAIPDSLRLAADTVYYTAAGGGQNVALFSNRSWSVSNPVSWAGVNPMSGSGNGTLFVSVNANASSVPRQGQLTIQAGAITRYLSIVQEGTTGLNESAQANWLNLYPNPGNGIFFIENKGYQAYTVTITDLSGQQIDGLKLESYSSTTLNGSEWPSGIYFVHFFNGSGSYFMKIVVMR